MEQGRWFDAIEVLCCLSACNLMTDSCILLSSAHDSCGIEGCCDVQVGVQDAEQNCVFRGFPSRHALPTGQVQVSWSHTHTHCGHKHPICCCARPVSFRRPASIRYQVNIATVHSQHSLVCQFSPPVHTVFGFPPLGVFPRTHNSPTPQTS
jgi:hypothetical protein